jgi:hypothetical protein
LLISGKFVPLEGFEQDRRRVEAVAGDADETHQPQRVRLAGAVQGPVRPGHLLQFLERRHRVKLEQVEAVRPQAFQRTADLLEGAGAAAFLGLGGQEEIRAAGLHPRAHPQLGVAVRGGDVDVVDAVPQQDIQRFIRNRLRNAGERRRAEQRTGADLTRFTERDFLDHPVVILSALGRGWNTSRNKARGPAAAIGPAAAFGHGDRHQQPGVRSGKDRFFRGVHPRHEM